MPLTDPFDHGRCMWNHAEKKIERQQWKLRVKQKHDLQTLISHGNKDTPRKWEELIENVKIANRTQVEVCARIPQSSSEHWLETIDKKIKKQRKRYY